MGEGRRLRCLDRALQQRQGAGQPHHLRHQPRHRTLHRRKRPDRGRVRPHLLRKERLCPWHAAQITTADIDGDERFGRSQWARITSTTYSADGYFPRTVTNPLLQTVTTTTRAEDGQAIPIYMPSTQRLHTSIASVTQGRPMTVRRSSLRTMTSARVWSICPDIPSPVRRDEASSAPSMRAGYALPSTWGRAPSVTRRPSTKHCHPFISLLECLMPAYRDIQPTGSAAVPVLADQERAPAKAAPWMRFRGLCTSCGSRREWASK